VIYTTLHRKLKIEQHEPHHKRPVVNSVLWKGRQVLLHMVGFELATIVVINTDCK
jgi:hypothetical protein